MYIYIIKEIINITYLGNVIYLVLLS